MRFEKYQIGIVKSTRIIYNESRFNRGVAIKKRIIAIDFGEKRIGVAVSDPLGITAQPVGTLKSVGKKGDVAALVTLIEEKGADAIILGMPFRLDGSEGTLCARIKKIGRALEAATGLKVEYQDERFTSEEASDALREASVRGKKKKKVIDTIAAQLILQRYLDSAE